MEVSPPVSINMDMINKLSSMAKDSATLEADNQDSTTLVSSSDTGALKAVSDKDNNSMQIDDITQCWNNGDIKFSPHVGNKNEI